MGVQNTFFFFLKYEISSLKGRDVWEKKTFLPSNFLQCVEKDNNLGTIEFQTNQQNKSSRCDNDDAIQYSRWIPISKKSLTALQLQSLTAFVKYYYHSELWLLPTSYTTNGLIISFNLQNNWKKEEKISSVFSIMFIIIVLCMHIKNGKILFQNDDQPLSTYQKKLSELIIKFCLHEVRFIFMV